MNHRFLFISRMYRFIRMTSDGTVVAEVQDDYTIRLADATQVELNAPNNNGEPILVAWNTAPSIPDNSYIYTASWVQRLDNTMLGIFPMLVMPQEL